MYWIKKAKKNSNRPWELSYDNLKYWSYLRRPIANTMNRYYLISNGHGGFLRDRFFTKEDDGSFKIYVGYEFDREKIPQTLYDTLMQAGGSPNLYATSLPDGGNEYAILHKKLRLLATVRPDNTIEFHQDTHAWSNFDSNSINHLITTAGFHHRKHKGGTVFQLHTKGRPCIPLFKGLTLDLDTLLPTEECKSKYEVVCHTLSRKKSAEMMAQYKAMLNIGKSMFGVMSDQSFYPFIKDVLDGLNIGHGLSHDSGYHPKSRPMVLEEIRSLVAAGLDTEAFALYAFRANYQVRRLVRGQPVYTIKNVDFLVNTTIDRFKKEIKLYKFESISKPVLYELGKSYPNSPLIVVQPKEKQHV